jgi:NhaA family Na+:H+ antiporter
MRNPRFRGRILHLRPHHFHPRRLVGAAQAFIAVEASGGIVLLAAAMLALAWVNSPWGDSYTDLWHSAVSFDSDVFSVHSDLRAVVNDGLMTLFFFVMGLEIKRELVRGELSSLRRALLPAASALGGMILPATIYLLLNAGRGEPSGWGIPMATDIAFAVGVLALLGRRVPFGLKIFLLALAIADDIGAIAVIAVFYASSLDVVALCLGVAILAGVIALNRAGVRNPAVYVVPGLMLWLALFESGIHATIAGVVLGLLAPASRFDPADESDGQEAPLQRLERLVHPWASYAVVPLFALANAGVEVSGGATRDALANPEAQGVVLGLVLGKPAGIAAFTWLAVRLRLCELPRGVSWRQIVAVGCLGGMGFTVSLLITGLAFSGRGANRRGEAGGPGGVSPGRGGGVCPAAGVWS